MARLTLNVDQADFDSAGRTFDPVLAGDYKVTIFSITEDTVKEGANAGKGRLKFQFRIVDGELDSNGVNQGNRRLFSDINTFGGKSKTTGKDVPPFDLVAIGKALGTTLEELNNGFDTDEWLGEELQVTVKWVKKQEKVGEKWVDKTPVEYKEKVGGYRSLESVAESAAATAKVTGPAKAATGAKAGVAPKAPAKKALIKL
jgi:hypothetical protein